MKLKALMAVDDKKYILYVRTSCPFCKKAEELLIQRGESHFVVPFDTQPEALAHMKWAYSQETVPIIFKKDGSSIEFIGGYSDLVKHFDE
jgi:glutaredoxin